LVAFTGVKFDRELTQEECIALMTDVYCNRERFQDTKILENKLASARDWLDHLSFTTTSKDKRYNLVYDCWRSPVITNNRSHAQFITRPYFSEVEFAKVLKMVKNSYKNCINKLVSDADYLELFQKPHNSFTKTKNGNWIRAGLALYIEKVASQKEIAEIIGVSDRVFRYHLKKDFVRTSEEYKKGVEKEYSILL